MTLSGWAIQDEGPELAFQLDDITLAGGESVQLSSGTPRVAGPGQEVLTNRNIWKKTSAGAHLLNGRIEISQKSAPPDPPIWSP